MCVHCGEPVSEHCPWCLACAGNACPDWCEPDEEQQEWPGGGLGPRASSCQL